MSVVDKKAINEIDSAEKLLAYLRRGQNQKLEIGFEDWKIPCRIISAGEMLKLQVRGEMRARELNPTGEKMEAYIAFETMKLVLDSATTIDKKSFFSRSFLDGLPNNIIESLYDQYITIINVINPNIQSMSNGDIMKIVDDIKKNKTVTKNYFTYQLAEVGKFFLEEILPLIPMGKDVGSP
jgi:hypothetical protein